jgi:hypothetical protein
MPEKDKDKAKEATATNESKRPINFSPNLTVNFHLLNPTFRRENYYEEEGDDSRSTDLVGEIIEYGVKKLIRVLRRK